MSRKSCRTPEEPSLDVPANVGRTRRKPTWAKACTAARDDRLADYILLRQIDAHGTTPLRQFRKALPGARQGTKAPTGKELEPRAHLVLCADADVEEVAQLLGSAEQDGDRFWIPQRDGDTSSYDAFEGSNGVVVCCCSGATPDFACRELSQAADAGKTIVAILLGGARASEAVLYFVSVHNVIDSGDRDWRSHFGAALSFGRPLQRRPPRFVERLSAVRPVRRTCVQSFVNAFAAGVALLFGFAIMDLTGGPPTGPELRQVAGRMWAFAFGPL